MFVLPKDQISPPALDSPRVEAAVRVPSRSCVPDRPAGSACCPASVLKARRHALMTGCAFPGTAGRTYSNYQACVALAAMWSWAKAGLGDGG